MGSNQPWGACAHGSHASLVQSVHGLLGGCHMLLALVWCPRLVISCCCFCVHAALLHLSLFCVQLTISRTPNLLARGVLTVNLKKCTNLEVRSLVPSLGISLAAVAVGRQDVCSP